LLLKPDGALVATAPSVYLNPRQDSDLGVALVYDYSRDRIERSCELVDKFLRSSRGKIDSCGKSLLRENGWIVTSSDINKEWHGLDPFPPFCPRTDG
jgi:hypothetical protein